MVTGMGLELVALKGFACDEGNGQVNHTVRAWTA